MLLVHAVYCCAGEGFDELVWLDRFQARCGGLVPTSNTLNKARKYTGSGMLIYIEVCQLSDRGASRA